MCNQGCSYENKWGECIFVAKQGELYPCAEFFCIKCKEEITRIDIEENNSICPYCGHKYEYGKVI